MWTQLSTGTGALHREIHRHPYPPACRKQQGDTEGFPFKLKQTEGKRKHLGALLSMLLLEAENPENPQEFGF